MLKLLVVLILVQTPIRFVSSGSNSDRFSSFLALKNDLEGRGSDRSAEIHPVTTSGDMFSVNPTTLGSVMKTRIVKKVKKVTTKKPKPKKKPKKKQKKKSPIKPTRGGKPKTPAKKPLKPSSKPNKKNDKKDKKTPSKSPTKSAKKPPANKTSKPSDKKQ